MAYYTDKERKEPFEYEADYFHFSTKRDLSGGIVITRTSTFGTKDKLIADVAEFVANFMLWHYPHLNGFSGIDTVNWIFEDI